jgi:hypothetical protein
MKFNETPSCGPRVEAQTYHHLFSLTKYRKQIKNNCISGEEEMRFS